MTDFRHELENVDESLHIRLFGELGLGERDEVNALVRAAQGDNRAIVVDLRGLSFIDSSGIQSLLQGQLRADAAGTPFHLVPGPPRVQRLFEMTGLTSVLRFTDPD